MATSGSPFFLFTDKALVVPQSVLPSCLLSFMPLCQLGNLLDWATFRRQQWSYPGSRHPMTSVGSRTSLWPLEGLRLPLSPASSVSQPSFGAR